MLALLPLAAAAADAPPADPVAEAKRLSTRGAVEITVGSAAMAGALAVLLVRKGEPGAEIQDPPPQWVLDLRSAGGAVLMMSGFTVVLVGGRDLGKAAAARDAAVVLVPAANGLALAGVF